MEDNDSAEGGKKSPSAEVYFIPESDGHSRYWKGVSRSEFAKYDGKSIVCTQDRIAESIAEAEGLPLECISKNWHDHFRISFRRVNMVSGSERPLSSDDSEDDDQGPDAKKKVSPGRRTPEDYWRIALNFTKENPGASIEIWECRSARRAEKLSGKKITYTYHGWVVGDEWVIRYNSMVYDPAEARRLLEDAKKSASANGSRGPVERDEVSRIPYAGVLDSLEREAFDRIREDAMFHHCYPGRRSWSTDQPFRTFGSSTKAQSVFVTPIFAEACRRLKIKYRTRIWKYLITILATEYKNDPLMKGKFGKFVAGEVKATRNIKPIALSKWALTETTDSWCVKHNREHVWGPVSFGEGKNKRKATKECKRCRSAHMVARFR